MSKVLKLQPDHKWNSTHGQIIKLRDEVYELKQQRRKFKTQLSHLQNRTYALLSYLDEKVVPKLKRRKRLKEAMEPVRRLVE